MAVLNHYDTCLCRSMIVSAEKSLRTKNVKPLGKFPRDLSLLDFLGNRRKKKDQPPPFKLRVPNYAFKSCACLRCMQSRVKDMTLDAMFSRHACVRQMALIKTTIVCKTEARFANGLLFLSTPYTAHKHFKKTLIGCTKDKQNLSSVPPMSV